jgi:DNA invertase Pin-like site-specific DNA recombinase
MSTDITLMDIGWTMTQNSNKTVLYARVSTSDQNLDHQKTQAEAAGFVIDEVVADHGVSGVSTTHDERQEGRRLADMLRSGDTLVVRWVDRLGRNYQDVTDTIRSFMRQGVVVRTVINNMTFDGATKDPMQEAVRDALIAFMAATAQAQAEANKEAQRAGIDANMSVDGKYRGGKPSYDRKTFERVVNRLATEGSVSAIARDESLTRQTVLRIRDQRDRCEAALTKWGM